jgi:hypothetical protein
VGEINSHGNPPPQKKQTKNKKEPAWLVIWYITKFPDSKFKPVGEHVKTLWCPLPLGMT